MTRPRFLRPHPSAPPTAPAETGQALESWYHEHGQAIYRYVRFHLPSADEAEDVTAETFLKAFRAAERYEASRGGVRTWLFRIARNCIRDHQRRARVRRHIPIGNMRDLTSDAPSPEERVLWEEQVGRLLEAVSRLSERDRELISLRYGSGLDTAAIAETLGVRESAVRTRLWRALTRLRGLVEDER